MNERSSYWLTQLGWAAFVAFGFSIWQVWKLRTGHLSVDVLDSGAIIAGHVVVALFVALPAVALCQFSRAFLRTLPPFWIVFCLVFVELRLRLLPGLLTRTTLLVGLTLLAAVAVTAFLWSRRPWDQRLDRAGAILVVALGLVVFSWARGGGTAPGLAQVGAHQDTPDLASKPDIYLILIDALRADHLGLYGYPMPTSPALDRLASNAVVFDNAYSVSNWTRPTVASLLTSTMPSVHNVIRLDRAVPESLPLVAEILNLAGYSTAVFSPGGNLATQDGYLRGVEHFYPDTSRSALERTPIGGKILKRAMERLRTTLGGQTRVQFSPGHLAARATEWIRAAPELRPVFVYLHLPGPHAPYMPPLRYASVFSDQEPSARLSEPPRRKWSGENWLSDADRRQMIAQYDGEILLHDEVVGVLLDSLVQMDRPRPAYFIITADHGEGFGEHGVWGHGVGLFNEITRVPLVIARLPTSENSGRRAVPASLLDLAPTFVELAGVEPLDSFQGVSLVPWLEGSPAPAKEVLFENPLYDEEGLVTLDWVFLRGRSGVEGEDMGSWLFKTKDVLQADDLSTRENQLNRELNLLLDSRLQALRERTYAADRITLEKERIEQLRGLGYLD